MLLPFAVAAVAFDVSGHLRLVPKARAPPPTATSPVERRRDLSRLQYASGIITDEKRDRSVALDEEIDLRNASATFDFLCRAADYDDIPKEDVSMDIDDFQLAFEQLFCGGVPLDEEVAVELMAAVNTLGWRADVAESDWQRFHAEWLQATTAPAYLEAILDRKKVDSMVAHERIQNKGLQKKLNETIAAQEAQAAAQPAGANPLATKLMTGDGKSTVGNKGERPKLLADLAKKATGAPSAAASRYRSLDPSAWSSVVNDVGGLDEVLESIRRRIWVPLCAPRSLLEELGGRARAHTVPSLPASTAAPSPH